MLVGTIRLVLFSAEILNFSFFAVSRDFLIKAIFYAIFPTGEHCYPIRRDPLILS